MAFTGPRAPGRTRQLAPREVRGAHFLGLTFGTNELRLSGTGRGVNICPEPSLYIDTKRELQPAGGEASFIALSVSFFGWVGAQRTPPFFEGNKMSPPSLR